MAENISVENAKWVANLEKMDGRLRLGELLGWAMEDFDEDAQMRESILLDFLYGSLMFGVQKGVPWSQVPALVQVASQFQQGTIGQPLSSAIKIYREISQRYLNENKISESNLRLFTSHLFETYMAHYQLYQMVFTTDREPMTVKQHLDVIPPPEAYPLDEAKPLSVWEYERQINELEEEEKSRLNDIKVQEETILNDIEENQPFKESKDSVLDRQQVSELIQDAIQHHTSQTEKLLQTRVEGTLEDLSFYLEKTALPRPEHLGPPPRTKDPPRLSAKSRAGVTSAKSKKSKKSAKTK
ncbi:uncharacterized protein C8orf74 [Strongylocentrotus purpuratus]|uniref:Uncharacterized protein n=1 Tax=Strongylocentrotus purpuratus TaxID=7668 RepID=A0A7M7RE08_STRPU|nr:uncharacterized protein C8orf74 [Strongylocentrotus purpuratus]|eukprot:XP_785503.1 PREDICTED: uncharacterized protein C8orf74 [Strongylocentrotus purpuratus]